MNLFKQGPILYRPSGSFSGVSNLFCPLHYKLEKRISPLWFCPFLDPGLLQCFWPISFQHGWLALCHVRGVLSGLGLEVIDVIWWVQQPGPLHQLWLHHPLQCLRSSPQGAWMANRKPLQLTREKNPSLRTKTSMWRSWKFPTALGVEQLLASYSDVKSLWEKNRLKLWFCFGDQSINVA